MKKYFDLMTPLFVNEREPFAARKTDNSVEQYFKSFRVL